ncbi:hypothetical protein [Collimonas sp. PA-H2]|uniref:hypothetical protein n=1 Tax=Collimonas sp. PA-H2 TaxID=1881062 RepID=UPI000BFA3723|nr:hypothetical protein [Collimonas sp. PA-H2]
MPNKKTVVQTNSTKNSVKEVPLKVVTFAELWTGFPHDAPCKDPAIVAALVGLYAALPPSTVECGDECGGKALEFALGSGLTGGIFFAVLCGLLLTRRQKIKHKTGSEK